MPRKNRSGKIKHMLVSITKFLFEKGKGKSKHEEFQKSYDKNETRQTDYIHTYATENRYEKVVAKFSDFLKEEFNLKYVRDFKDLSTEEIYICLDRYFEKQRDEEHLSASTLKLHISALEKVLCTIRPSLREYFTPENRAKWRDGVEKGDNDRYNNPDRVIENLHKIDETSYAIAQIQRTSGARIGDVKKLVLDEENMRAYIPGSKGGRHRSIHYDHSPEEFQKLKEYKEILDKALQEKKFSEIREEEYYKNLRKACRMAQEPYKGSHPFRYEFAQTTYETIKELPKEEQEQYYRTILREWGRNEEDIEGKVREVKEKDMLAEAIISEFLGHSRLDISLHYLKIRRK